MGRSRARSAGAVDVASVIDGDDRHDPRGLVGPGLVDLIDDAEVTSSSAVFAFEVEPERSADPLRVLGQTAVYELDAGGGDLLGETI